MKKLNQIQMNLFIPILSNILRINLQGEHSQNSRIDKADIPFRFYLPLLTFLFFCYREKDYMATQKNKKKRGNKQSKKRNRYKNRN